MNINDSSEHKFTEEQIKELERRWSDYENGIGKTYTWKQTVAITDKALAARKKTK